MLRMEIFFKQFGILGFPVGFFFFGGGGGANF